MKDNKELPYLIVELANSHAGDITIIERLIEEFSALDYERKGVKFQVLAPDKIALPDFEWYQVYEELYFSLSQWRHLFERVDDADDIWLDIFDIYGVEVFLSNVDIVSGIKLQASVLYNYEIRAALERSDLSEKTIIVNISGLEISAAQDVVLYFEKKFNKVVVQFGFQSYPTKIEDTGLCKIPVLKGAFPYSELCIADHADAETDFAKNIPIYGAIIGCGYIEKHACLDRKKAKYDGFSALTFEELASVCEGIKEAFSAMGSRFVSEAEKEYLAKSIQVPVLKHDIKAGGLVGEQDVIYRRTSQKGLNAEEIQQLQKRGRVIANPISKHSAVTEKDFRKANVGVVVAGRMKSTRLPNKAILPIAGTPSIELCLKQCQGIQGVDKVILATSYLESDAVLENHTLNDSIKLWKGDPDDVISRYLGACDYYDIDIVVRVTADCPFIMPDIVNFLLEKHFESGADYTAADSCAVGTSGEIINTSALREISKIFGCAEYSEYMTWYFRNNPEYFKLNFVSLPNRWLRDYRMTLDYPEDLEMFERLSGLIDSKASFYGIDNVFEVLDSNPEVANINKHLTLRYEADEELIKKLDSATRIINALLNNAR